MVVKSKIVMALGEDAIAMPTLVNSALMANDRLKYRFTLLQGARAHALHPEHNLSNLRAERLNCGIESAELDAVVMGSARENGGYRIPQAKTLLAGIFEDMTAMLAPFEDSLALSPELGHGAFHQRLKTLLQRLDATDKELIHDDVVSLITSGRRDAGDSLHLLVMDAHKALNRLQVELAADNVDGASVYGIDLADREVIQAFMRGLQRTAALKFDHPGLGTTATRVGPKLIIQNDIGTTDAHVLVVHVVDDCVSVTYTDVHLQRLIFFQGLFRGWKVSWEDARSRADQSMEDGVYHLSVGHHEARDRESCLRFMEFLGSRLVYLIDWNKARKQLKLFVPKNDARELLSWAADNDLGHMAFLRCGGQQMLFEILELVGRGAFRYGEALHEIVGIERARSYLQFALRTCSRAMLSGKQVDLVRDELRAELFGYFKSAEQGLFDLLAEHAYLTVEIAASLRDAWLELGDSGFSERVRARAQRAKEWERRADQLVIRIREAATRSNADDIPMELVKMADDVPDELEEATFHCALMPDTFTSHGAVASVALLQSVTLSATQEYVKTLLAARSLRHGGGREDMQDFFESVHRVLELEKMADDALRQVRRDLLKRDIDSRELFVINAVASNLEQATDSLMHTVQWLRDRMLAQNVA